MSKSNSGTCPIHGIMLERDSQGGVIEWSCPACEKEHNTPEAANRRTKERAARRKARGR